MIHLLILAVHLLATIAKLVRPGGVRAIVAELSIGRPSLKVLPVRLNPQRGPVGIVTLKSRMVSPVARLFIDSIREVAKPLAKTAMSED